MDLRTLDYPRHVHKPSEPGDWKYLKVADAEACAAALADGWSLTPIVIGHAPAAPEMNADDAIAPPVVDEPVAAVKPAAPKKRGRPRKG